MSPTSDVTKPAARSGWVSSWTRLGATQAGPERAGLAAEASGSRETDESCRPASATSHPAYRDIENPRFAGAFRSRPVSRILSCAAIYLAGASSGGALRPCGLPGPRRAGSTVLLGLAPGGVCLAAASPRRRCALTAPFHLCLCAAHVRPRHRPCVSVALSRGFRRVGATHRPCPVVSGLSSRASPPAAARPALPIVGRGGRAPRASPRARPRGGGALGELGPAARAGAGLALAPHEPLAQRAAGLALGAERMPEAQHGVLEALARGRGEAGPEGGIARRRRRGIRCRDGGHQRLRKTPITRPSSFASRVRIGW